MSNPNGHVPDDQLVEFNDDGRDSQRVREHIAACEPCRRRRQELAGLRALLAQTGQRERRPVRDVVPSAMMRLRLRRHGVTNANELLEGFAAFMRGLASLFAVPAADSRFAGRMRDAEDEHHG